MQPVYRDKLSGDLLEETILEVREYMIPIDTFYLDDELPDSPMNGFFYASSFALIVNVDGLRVWVPVSEDMTLSPDYADAMKYQDEAMLDYCATVEGGQS